MTDRVSQGPETQNGRKARRSHASGPPGRAASLRFLITILLLCGADVAFGQDAAYAPLPTLPLGDLVLSLPTAHAPAAGVWEVRFSHRFNQSLDQGTGRERLHSLWGLDGSADVAIGLSYAATRDLQFSLLRSNALDDMELAARYIVVQQAPAIPLSLAIRAGSDVRTESELRDRTSAFGQAIISHQFGNRAEISIVPSFVTNAGRATDGETSTALFRHAFNVPASVSVRLLPALSLAAELIPRNRDLPGGTHADIGWAVGLKRAIGGHFFELLVTNSNATHVDQYVTSTYQGAPLRRGDLHLGFNIERRFGGR